MNLYEWFVENEIIYGKQMTVVWNVDDLKISHVNVDALDTMISQISE